MDLCNEPALLIYIRVSRLRSSRGHWLYMYMYIDIDNDVLIIEAPILAVLISRLK